MNLRIRIEVRTLFASGNALRRKRYENFQVLLTDYAPSVWRCFINRHAVTSTPVRSEDYLDREHSGSTGYRGRGRAGMDQKFIARTVPADAGIWSRGSELLKSGQRW